MADGGVLKIRIEGDSSGLEREIEKADGSATKLGKNMLTELNSGLELASKAINTIGTAMKQTVGQFASFEDSMLQVKATMNATDEDYAKMTEAAKEAGATTRYTASEAASALNYMALAGYDAETSIAALPQVLSLAQAGGGSLASTSDMLTDSLSALGLGVDYMQTLSDQMATAAQKSNTSVTQLGDAILTVGGTAANLKNGTAELSAALGVLANNSIKGSEGGTHLRNMILRLQEPTKDGAAVLKKYTNGVYDAQGNMRGLDEIFGELNKNMATLTQAERDSAMSDLFRVTDLAAASAMLKGMNGEYAALYSNILESDGACADMADTMESGLAGSMRSLSSAWEGFQISLGDGISSDIGVQGLTDNLTALVRELTSAFENGGWDGLAESIASAAPQMIQTLGSTLGTVFGTIGKQLPTFMKSFTSVLPDLIGGAFAGADGLIEYGGMAMEMLITGLIENFPQYVGVIADGISNLFADAVRSITNIGATLTLGTMDALFGTTFLDSWNNYQLPPLSTAKLFGNVTDEYKKDVKATIDGEITASELTEKIKTTSDTLTGQVEDMYTAIMTAFTDGKPDTDAVVQDLISGEGATSVESMYTEAVQLANDTYGEGSEEALAAIERLNAWKEGSSNWVAEMAGKSSEYVNAHLDELRGYIDEYKQMMNEFAKMADENSVEAMAYKRTTAGAATDQRDIDNALDYANAKKRTKDTDITKNYNDLKDKAIANLKNGKIDQSTYDSLMASYADQYQRALEASQAEYDERIRAITEGVMQSMGVSERTAIQDAMKNKSLGEEAGQVIADYGSGGEGNAFTFDNMSDGLKESFGQFLSEYSMYTDEQIAAYMSEGGLEGNQGVQEQMQQYLIMYQESVMEQASAALEGMDWGMLGTLIQDGALAGLWGSEGDGTDVDVIEWLKQYYPELFGGEPVEVEATPDITVDTSNGGIELNDGEPVESEITVQPEATFEQPEGIDVGAVFGDLGDQTIPMNPTIDASGAVAQATAAKQQIATAMDASSEARTAGSNTAAGLAQGLATAVSTAATLGAAAGRAFTAAYKANQQIASPSKVMRRMGEFTVQGLARGLNDGAKVATTEARALARSLNDTLSISPRSRFDMSGVEQSFTNALSNHASTPVYLNGTQIAELQGYNNSAALALENARIARGVGSR